MKIVEKITDKHEEQDRIFKKYPKIFRQKDLTIQESCMPWGLDIGYGWMPLIDLVCSYTQNCIDEYKLLQLEATQVKEKYGGLRFYYSWVGNKKMTDEQNKYIDRIESLISDAEYISNYICERCGTMIGVFQTKGWITTICKKCAEGK